MGKRNWNPWTEHFDSSDCLDTGLPHDAAPKRISTKRAQWRPIADIFQTSQALVLQIELPGLQLEDVGVEIKYRELIVFGQRRCEKDVQGATYHTMERGHGYFSRRFPLPPTANSSAVNATLKDGLLTIVIPKKEICDSNRRIPIETT
ncbi:MAG: Hsp20/alpha crystallin family protein [Desulfovibrio sp.]|uniref:Hsp20/alpha crystallin family protein n=1 Tax=Desulfovibrio sp. 7SRBS1 TaxID=3378064 RepID=UPI003B3E9B33